MELNEAMSSRRSIRRYEKASIEKSDIDACIKAAILAPTWKNSQTGRYFVVQSEEMLEEFKTNCLPEFNRNNVENASALIVTGFVKNRSGFSKDGTPDNEAGNGWGFYDLGLANMNLLLKATELGYGTLVMGIRDEAHIRELLNIDETITIVSVISIGKSDIDPSMPRRKNVEDITKYY